MVTETTTMPSGKRTWPLSPYYRARVRVGVACVASFCVMWWAGRLLAIPIQTFFDASLFQQPSPVLTTMIVTVLFLLCAAGATLVAGRVRYNAGLAAALAGLSAISMRCGTSRDAILRGLADIGSPALFLVLAGEAALLGLMVVLCGWGVAQLHVAGVISEDDTRETERDHPPARTTLASLGIQTAITAALVLVLCASEARQQALAGVFLASMLGAIVAEAIAPAGRYGWYWAPPIVIGVVGYLIAWADPRGIETASLYGPLAALARPLPLDYASAAPAGAIWGHWIAHRWMSHSEEDEEHGEAA